MPIETVDLSGLGVPDMLQLSHKSPAFSVEFGISESKGILELITHIN